MTWAKHLFSFYSNLHPPTLPPGISWLLPHINADVQCIMKTFYNKFYNDQEQRTIVLGINPGRFGAGITGVNFTAARQLFNNCGIKHPFQERSELSAEFIYEVIELYGGPKKFYHSFFIGSVCPLGLVQEGKNINYYDDKHLSQKLQPFIVESLNQLLSFGHYNERCICIGGEKNYKSLRSLNDKHQWFESIDTVPHPRFIMQYRRKQKTEYLQAYIDTLNV